MRKAWAMLLAVGAWGSGCFPAPRLPLDAADETEAVDVTETAPEADTSPDSELETEVVAEVATEVVAEVEAETEVSTPTCDQDDDCTALAAPPCRIGKCDNHACKAVDLNTTCDDGDPCTTADACAAGACHGRLYTAAEAKNWAFQFGGDGEDAAIAATLHPDGNVDVVGGFHGTATLPGGLTLEAPDANAHAFLVRVTPRGQVLRAFVIPPDPAPTDPPTTTEIAMGVAVSDGTDDRTLVGLLESNGVVTSSRLVWLNDNGSVAASVRLPGFLHSLDAHLDGSAIALLEIREPVTVRLVEGTTTIDPLSTHGTVVARVAQNGVLWAKGVIGPGTSSPLSLVDLADKFAFSATVDGATSFGGESLSDATASELGLEIAANEEGRLSAQVDAGHGALLARWRRKIIVDTRFGWDAGGNPQITVGPLDDELHRSCTASFPGGEGESNLGAFGRAVPLANGGFLFTGSQIGKVDFPPATTLDAGSGATSFVVFDAECRAQKGWISQLLPRNGAPPSIRVADEFSALFGAPVGLPTGGVVTATFVELPTDLGDPFGNALIDPSGEADVLVVGHTFQWIHGCATSP